MNLFRDIETVGKYVPYLPSSDFDTVKIYLEKAEHRYLRASVLGTALYDGLITLVNSSTAGVEPPDLLSPDQVTLLDKCRSVAAHLGAHMASGIGNVLMASGGMSVGITDNSRPADKYRVEEAKKGLISAGYHALDQLIEYLFACSNLGSNPHTEWIDTQFYRVWRQGTIRSVADAEMSGVNLGGSAWLLYNLKPAIQRAEEVVAKVLPEGEFTVLQNELNGTTGISAARKRLLDKVRPAVVHLALGESILPLSLTLDTMGLWAFEASGSAQGGPKQASIKEKQALAEHWTALGMRGLKAVEELAHELSDAGSITQYPSTTTDPYKGFVGDTDSETYAGGL